MEFEGFKTPHLLKRRQKENDYIPFLFITCDQEGAILRYQFLDQSDLISATSLSDYATLDQLPLPIEIKDRLKSDLYSPVNMTQYNFSVPTLDNQNTAYRVELENFVNYTILTFYHLYHPAVDFINIKLPFFELSPNLCAILDNRAEIKRANQAFITHLNLVETSLQPINLINCVDPRDKLKLMTFLQSESKSQSKKETLRLRLINIQGEPEWLNCHLVKEAHQNIIFFIAEKITDFMTNENLFNQLQKQANIGSWQYDKSTNTLNWSTQVYEIHKVPLGTDMTIERSMSFYDHESKSLIKKLINDALEKGLSFKEELTIIDTKGDRKRIRTTITPTIDGDTITGIAGTFSDITKQKQTELNFERLFNETNQCILIGSDQAVIEKANAAFVGLFGYDHDQDLIGHSILELLADIQPDGLKKEDHVPKIIQALKEKKSLCFLNNFLKKDGSSILVEVKLSLYQDINGSNKLIAFVDDITKRIEDENKLKKNIQDLEQAHLELKETQDQLLQSQKLESMGRLASGVAHDFNNILAGILGYTNLLIKEFSNNEKILKKLSIIEDASKRGSHLTQQLLGFARKGQIEKEPVNLSRIIHECFDIIKNARPRPFNLLKETQSNLPFIEGDANQLLQVILNLGINAVDAIDDHGTVTIGTKKIIITKDTPLAKTFKPGEYVELFVQDTGTGISQDIKNKIFDPFFTTKDTGKGSGLGLSMVDGIVKKHRGQIILETTQGVGTTFRLIFPAIEKPENPSEETSDFFADEDANHILKDKHILIADDENLMIDLAKDIFSVYNAHVQTATNGLEALVCYQENPSSFDLIILDMQMPKMDGYEAYEKIKEIAPPPPVLFSSGFDESFILEKIDTNTNIATIQKPFDMHTLIQESANLLKAANPKDKD